MTSHNEGGGHMASKSRLLMMCFCVMLAKFGCGGQTGVVMGKIQYDELGKKLLVGNKAVEFREILPGTYYVGRKNVCVVKKEFDDPAIVKIMPGILMSAMEIDQYTWECVMRENPSIQRDVSLPVHNLSLAEAIRFCARLQTFVEPNFIVRLPTSAEWQVACKAGAADDYGVVDISGKSINYFACPTSNPHLCMPWHHRNCIIKSGLLSKNPWGFYDMHGNVEEYVLDESSIMDIDGMKVSKAKGGWYSLNKRAISASAIEWNPMSRNSVVGLRLVIHKASNDQSSPEEGSVYSVARKERVYSRVNEVKHGMSTEEIMTILGQPDGKLFCPKGTLQYSFLDDNNKRSGFHVLFNENGFVCKVDMSPSHCYFCPE